MRDVQYPTTSTTSIYSKQYTSTGDTSFFLVPWLYNCSWHTTGYVQYSTEVHVTIHEGPHGGAGGICGCCHIAEGTEVGAMCSPGV